MFLLLPLSEQLMVTILQVQTKAASDAIQAVLLNVATYG